MLDKTEAERKDPRSYDQPADDERKGRSENRNRVEDRVDDWIDDRRDSVTDRLIDTALCLSSRRHERHAKACQQDTFQHFL